MAALRFNEELQSVVTQGRSGNGAQLTLVYLDKQFFPRDIKQTVKLLDAISPDVQVVTVLPKTIGYDNYPFSLSFLLQCFCRCLSRSMHPNPMLKNDDPCQLLKTLLVYLSQFKNHLLSELVPKAIVSHVEFTT